MPIPSLLPVSQANPKKPIVDINLMTGSLPAGSTFTRASTATYYDATGTLQTASSNVARFDYGPTMGGITNFIYNSSTSGTSVSGNTLPAQWQVDPTFSGSITVNVVNVGIDPTTGLQCVDVNYSGTPNQTKEFILMQFFSTEPASLQPWYIGYEATFSCYLALVGGSLTNCSILQNEREVGPSPSYNSINLFQSSALSLTSTTTRYSMTSTATNELTQYGQCAFRLMLTNGEPVNLTVRFAAPQFELGVATPSKYVQTTSGPVNVGSTPVGLLIENGRTNYIRNPYCLGAVAGTPGTQPTDWGYSSSSNGMALSILSTGYEMGMGYIDVQCSGTSTGSVGLFFAFDAVGYANPPINTTLSSSIYVKLIAGTLPAPGNGSLNHQLEEHGGTGGTNTNQQLISSLTNNPLPQCLFTIPSHVCTGTGDTTVYNTLVFTCGTGITANFTLRIGCPQLYVNAYGGCSTPILPPSNTVAQSTRANDQLTLPYANYYSPNAFTLWQQYIQTPWQNGNASAGLCFDDNGTGNYQIGLGVTANGTSPYSRLRNVSATTETSPNTYTQGYGGQVVNSGASFNNNTMICVDGGTAYYNGAQTYSLPPFNDITRLELTGSTIASSFVGLNAWFKKLRIWKRALSATELENQS